MPADSFLPERLARAKAHLRARIDPSSSDTPGQRRTKGLSRARSPVLWPLSFPPASARAFRLLPCVLQILETSGLLGPYIREARNVARMNAPLLKNQDWENLARQAKFQPGMMAALCSVSLRQLQRFFAEVFQQTPREWARERRCRIARQLVSEGWFNRAVAEELGYGNESHLCHEFKRFYGVPPQAFAPLYGGNQAAGLASHETPALRLPTPLRQSSDAVSIHPSQVTPSRLNKNVAFKQSQ